MAVQRLLALFAIVGLSCQLAVSAEESEYTAVVQCLIVDPGTVNLWRRLDNVHREQKYDDIIRSPNEPDGVAVVDCAKTYRIGAILRLQRSGNAPVGLRNVKIRDEWTHGDLDKQTKHVDDYFVQFSRGVTTEFIIELHRVKKLSGQDGLWTFRRYIGESLIAETSFDLIDCAGNIAESGIAKPPDSKEPHAAEAAAAHAALAEEAEETEEVVCGKEAPTGSHVKVKVCRTRTEIERRRENDQEFIREIGTTPVPPKR